MGRGPRVEKLNSEYGGTGSARFGPRGTGGGFFPQMTATTRAAREAEAQAAAPAAVSPPIVR